MGAQIFEDRYGVITQSLTPVSTAAGPITAAQTFTVQGLTTDMVVVVNPPSYTAYLGIAGASVSAENTLSVNFVNTSTAALTSASGTFKVYWFKPEHADSAVIL